MSMKTYKASEIVSQYAKLDADPDYIRLADLAQYAEALQAGITAIDYVVSVQLGGWHSDHHQLPAMENAVNQLRALLAAVRGE